MFPINSTDKTGFSLIEVLVAVTLLSFVAVGVMTMTTANVNFNSFTQHHTKAVQFAEDGLELLKRVDYNAQLPLYDGASATAVIDYGQDLNYPEYRRVLLVEWGMEISTLRSTVTWRSMGAANTNPVELTTLRVRP